MREIARFERPSGIEDFAQHSCRAAFARGSWRGGGGHASRLTGENGAAQESVAGEKRRGSNRKGSAHRTRALKFAAAGNRI
jgi:hypothetical protein